MVHLDRTWDVLLPHKVGAEGREGVMRAGNVSLTPPFSNSRWASFTCGYCLRVGISLRVGIVYVWVRALVFLWVGGAVGFDRSDDVDYIIPSRELPAT
jgi:hypothetical protein